MGFTFSKHTVDVEIEGKSYEINLGDADVLDKVQKWSEKLGRVDYAQLAGDSGRMALLAQDVRGYLKALLGDEQFADIFKARKFDFIDGLELFAYLYAEVTKSRVDEGFRANLAKYLPDVDWDATEASE